MPIPVALYLFRGYAFDSGDISFGEAENKDISFNRNGNINKVSISKRSVSFKLRGATDADLIQFENERENNIAGLINGSATPENIAVGAHVIYNALLTKVSPSAPISVGGVTNYESIDLEYSSQTYS